MRLGLDLLVGILVSTSENQFKLKAFGGVGCGGHYLLASRQQSRNVVEAMALRAVCCIERYVGAVVSSRSNLPCIVIIVWCCHYDSCSNFTCTSA